MSQKQLQNREPSHKPKIYISPKGAFYVKAEELFASPKVRATLQEMAKISPMADTPQPPLETHSGRSTK